MFASACPRVKCPANRNAKTSNAAWMAAAVFVENAPRLNNATRDFALRSLRDARLTARVEPAAPMAAGELVALAARLMKLA